VHWISTSRPSRSPRLAGVGLLELVLAVSLALLVATAGLALWVSVERAGARGADQTIQVIQSRVALARFEQDLRLASAMDCPFLAGGAVLEATADRLVVLTRGASEETLRLVAWEVVGTRLMRRWRECPPSRPATFPPSLFLDSKTMVEGLGMDSHFAFVVAGHPSDSGVPSSHLELIDSVTLVLRTNEGEHGTGCVSTTAQVGR
jgi:hypothetical protein